MFQVRIKDPEAKLPVFSTGEIGKENTIARHGIYGLYWLFNVDVPGTLFVQGSNNSIYLTQTLAKTRFQGLLYDYIRLEAPPACHSLQDSLYCLS